ncbi:zinc-binding alcohol dehydrogenase family protein [Terriglobus sp.]|uniref:zinc-binding alcohol dehydrogenase family protein n=1 Tax=Terriglobus sp. TaxID=1889013 RepID=UPI003AFFBCAC
MKAVGYTLPSPIEAPEALLDIELPEPEIGPRDLLVEVKAVSVNPVDVKVRAGTRPDEGAEYKVLGYDAAGVVVRRGRDCSLFKVGDEVWYAGSIARQGTNAQFHAVDERIVAPKPKSIGFAEAAALPLTAITAWELLFDRLGIDQFKGAQAHQRKGVLLVVGGAGGVGSILTQIASKLTALTVVATASRAETVQWCYGNGAHFVIDHHRPMLQQMEELKFPQAEYIAALTGTERHFPELANIVAPQGKIGIIDDPKQLDVKLLKRKSASLHWEYMFTRPVFQTQDILRQHDLLVEVARLVDLGTLRTTLTQHLGAINAQHLRRAHQMQESGTAMGKTVLGV